MQTERSGLHEEVIAGRNPVIEALKSGRPVDSVMIVRDNKQGPVLKIIALCREKSIPIKEVSPVKLDSLCPGVNHQGVAAVAAAHEYAEVEDILELARKRDEPPFLIVADDIEDPHNLGAMIRTAEAAGAHGVIIPKRNAAGLTSTVDKASSGALEYVPVARVANLASTIDELKKQGIWVYGADMEGQPYYKTDFGGAVAIVIGSEGKGISRLIKEKCDFLVSIPMRGKISSLNASVACGVLLYEVTRNRLQK
ncbi:MAG TPA: 23S rRNA (guanosine(2251)-2'-O)-methyltransferase RlmB [Clostridia bacterium]|nr:23S rRNA (guanosine(2251)-2'-O)-methyltransferase RlmB [Clostridia bacterium]